MQLTTGCKRYLLLYCFLFFLCINRVFAQPEIDPALYEQTSEVNNVMVKYNADYGNLSRFYVIQNSPERRQRLLSTVNAYIDTLDKLNFDKLNTGAKVDYILFNRDLHEQQYQLEKEAREYSSVKQWFPFADSMYAYEKLRRRGAVLNAQKLADDLYNWNRQIQDLQKKLEKQSSISVELGERAKETVNGLQDALKSIYQFYNGYDQMFTWWVPQPYKKANSLLAVYADSIKAKEKSISPQKKDSSGIKDNPIGTDELKRRLLYEMIDYTPEELVAIANSSHQSFFFVQW